MASDYQPNQIDFGAMTYGVGLPNYIDRDLFYSDQVSLSSIDAIDVKMYPNPCRGSVLISSNGLQKETVLEVYTTKGQLVEKKQLLSESFSASFSLPSGVYFVLVSDLDGKRYFREKLVVL
jgi:hypothetical protein